MKKLLFFCLIAYMFHSCVSESKQDMRCQIFNSFILGEANLRPNGQVKYLKQTVNEKDTLINNIVKWKSTKEYFFDRNGLMTKKVTHEQFSYGDESYFSTYAYHDGYISKVTTTHLRNGNEEKYEWTFAFNNNGIPESYHCKFGTSNMEFEGQYLTDKVGNIVKSVSIGVSESIYEYDGRNELLKSKILNVESDCEDIVSIYNKLNIIEDQYYINCKLDNSHQYFYDDKGCLIKEISNHTVSDAGEVRSHTFLYSHEMDKNGNLIRQIKKNANGETEQTDEREIEYY